MRVLLTRRSQRGAVALVTAFVTVMTLVMAAFAADLGLAYASTRQLQTASDAAALAAVAVYAQFPGDCETLRANAAAGSAAQAAADAYRTQNRPNSTGQAIQVTCLSGALRVTTSAQGDTPKIFGRILGGGSSIATTRTATAEMDVPPGVRSGLRPYALCNSDVPTGSLPSAVIEITGPGQAHTGSDCSAAEAGGNWWFLACPEDGNGSMSPDELQAAIINGCSGHVSVVKPQNAQTTTTLSSSLTLNCNDKNDRSEFCLAGDTGNSSHQNKKGYEAWDQILGKTIILPVFCSTPHCTPDTVNGSGSNAVFPVYKLASVVVCGYHLYDKNSKISSTGDCAGNSYSQSYVSGVDEKEIRLYLRFVRLQTASDNSDSECELGAGCDGGLRRVRLTQ